MSSERFSVQVGGGTCGIAASALEVFHSLKEVTSAVKLVGCQGLCHQEALIVIHDHQLDKDFYYGKVSAERAKFIWAYHLEEKEKLGGFAGTPPRELLRENDLNYLTQQKRIALRNIGKIDPLSLEDALEIGGAYKAISALIKRGMSGAEVIAKVKESGLKGRGGGGFLTGQKWEFAATQPSHTPKFVVCNGDEGDPGAFMDRSLLEGDPHSVIEGMMIAGYAIGASKGFAYIRAEYPLAIKHFQKALEDARLKGFLGQALFGSDFSFDIEVKQGAGAFVCGEETALLASLEGRRGMPRIRPPFPAVKGYRDCPTIINNVETLSNLPWIFAEEEGVGEGAKAFSQLGATNSRGTKVFALAGAIKRGGLVEVPMGMTIREVIERFGGGTKSGKAYKAVQLGGPSGGCIPASLFDTVIDYQAIAATGAIMGSGGMIILDESTCMVDLALYFLRFTQEESCGKCTFCRIGTLRMKEILELIVEGEGTVEHLQQLEALAMQVKGASLCGLGQTASNPVLTTLRYFRHEYLEHIEGKRCPAGVCKKLIHHCIKNEVCIACGLCKRACGVNAIEGVLRDRDSFKINQELCVNCGLCVQKCPKKAIVVV